MAKLPWWMKLEPTGTTPQGNYGARMRVRRIVFPYLVVVGIFRWLFRLPTPNPESCDGLEITEVKFG